MPQIASQVAHERNYAATRMQAVVRGRAARKRRDALRRQRAAKWAGLLDSEIDATLASSPSPLRAAQSDGAAANASPSPGRGAAAVAVGAELAASREELHRCEAEQDAVRQELDYAATHIQCLARTTKARTRAQMLRGAKRDEWIRLAAENADEL